MLHLSKSESEQMKKIQNGRRACFFLLFIAMLSFYGCLHRDSHLPNATAKTDSDALAVKSNRQQDITGNTALSERETAVAAHENFIRQAFDLAVSSGKKGNHTFGALLVYQGKVILTAENTVNTDNDPTRHAEINLLVKAKRELAPEILSQSTMYTSTAPCMLCCAAMRYRGVNKVVYGVSYETFAKETGYKNMGIACDKLYQETGKKLDWIGPILEEDGLKVFRYLKK